MDSRFLEKTLFFEGQASLLYDENLGYINTKCVDGGYLNIYEILVAFDEVKPLKSIFGKLQQL